MNLSLLRKYTLLVLLLLLLISFYYFRLDIYLTFEAIKKYQYTLKAWTIHHYFSAVVVYLMIFTALIAATIPCATILSLLGGFLFGMVGFIYAILGMTLGGLILYVAVRLAVERKKNPPKFSKLGWFGEMKKGFKKNAFNYILTFRLVPFFPCWLSNVTAGALHIPLKTFLSATILGIIPTTFLYVMVGRGLDTILESNKPFAWRMLLLPSFFYPLLGLILISLIPIIYKYVKKS